jgi:hypothetical protein
MGLDRKSREGLQVNNIPRYVVARIHMTIDRNLWLMTSMLLERCGMPIVVHCQSRNSSGLSYHLSGLVSARTPCGHSLDDPHVP